MSLLAARVPRQPITFMYGNLVWGPFSDEVWALYREVLPQAPAGATTVEA